MNSYKFSITCMRYFICYPSMFLFVLACMNMQYKTTQTSKKLRPFMTYFLANEKGRNPFSR